MADGGWGEPIQPLISNRGEKPRGLEFGQYGVIVFRDGAFEKMKRTPKAMRAQREAAAQIANLANALQYDRPDGRRAVYAVKSNRAGSLVKADNYIAVIDSGFHDTLIKAAALFRLHHES